MSDARKCPACGGETVEAPTRDTPRVVRCEKSDCMPWVPVAVWDALPRQSGAVLEVLAEMKDEYMTQHERGSKLASVTIGTLASWIARLRSAADTPRDVGHDCSACGKPNDNPDEDACDQCAATWPHLRAVCYHPDCYARATEHMQGHPGTCKGHVDWYHDPNKRDVGQCGSVWVGVQMSPRDGVFLHARTSLPDHVYDDGSGDVPETKLNGFDIQWRKCDVHGDALAQRRDLEQGGCSIRPDCATPPNCEACDRAGAPAATPKAQDRVWVVTDGTIVKVSADKPRKAEPEMYTYHVPIHGAPPSPDCDDAPGYSSQLHDAIERAKRAEAEVDKLYLEVQVESRKAATAEADVARLDAMESPPCDMCWRWKRLAEKNGKRNRLERQRATNATQRAEIAEADLERPCDGCADRDRWIADAKDTLCAAAGISPTVDLGIVAQCVAANLGATKEWSAAHRAEVKALQKRVTELEADLAQSSHDSMVRIDGLMSTLERVRRERDEVTAELRRVQKTMKLGAAALAERDALQKRVDDMEQQNDILRRKRDRAIAERTYAEDLLADRFAVDPAPPPPRDTDGDDVPEPDCCDNCIHQHTVECQDEGIGPKGWCVSFDRGRVPIPAPDRDAAELPVIDVPATCECGGHINALGECVFEDGCGKPDTEREMAEGTACCTGCESRVIQCIDDPAHCPDWVREMAEGTACGECGELPYWGPALKVFACGRGGCKQRGIEYTPREWRDRNKGGTDGRTRVDDDSNAGHGGRAVHRAAAADVSGPVTPTPLEQARALARAREILGEAESYKTRPRIDKLTTAIECILDHLERTDDDEKAI